MGAFLYRWAPLLARLLVVGIFFYSGFVKFLDLGGTAVYINETFIRNLGIGLTSSGGSIWRWLAVAAGTVEIAGAILILIGWGTRTGAFLLIAYLAVVTIVFHAIGWWYAPNPQVANMQALSSLKNLAIIAALLQLATYGPGRPSLDVRR